MRNRARQIPTVWANALKAAGITVLAFVLGRLVTAPFSASLSSVFSSPEKTDFELSDFFAQVADQRPVRKLSSNIVMLDIGRADRDGIAETLETLSLCSPKAIAVDINFELPKDNDRRLLDALNAGCPVVLPLGLTPDDNDPGSFRILSRPFFFTVVPGLSYGAANLPGKYARSTIREFALRFKMADASVCPSFAMAVAEKADSSAAAYARARDNNFEVIDYASVEIPRLTLEEVFANPESVTGKTVLVGAMNEAADMHLTPVRHSMSGMEIHAYALSTILDGRFYRKLPGYVEYGIAAVLCFLLVWYNISIKAKIRGLLLRLLQVLLIYLVVRIGYSLYVDHRTVTNFSMTLLMVAFGLFAIDVWNGSIGLWELAVKWSGRIMSRFRREEL